MSAGEKPTCSPPEPPTGDIYSLHGHSHGATRVSHVDYELIVSVPILLGDIRFAPVIDVYNFGL